MAIPYPPRQRSFFFDNLGWKGAEAEWLAYESLVSQLSDSWTLMSSVIVQRSRSSAVKELDLVLFHPEFGVVVGEVKSGERGRSKIQEADNQLENARGALFGRLKDRGVLEEGQYRLIRSFIFCPQATRSARPHELPPSLQANQVLVADDLDDLSRAIEFKVCAVPEGTAKLTREEIQDVAEFLNWKLNTDSSDVNLRQARSIHVSHQIEDRASVLAGLRDNSRVFVGGGAGSGKTWLAMEWARGAADDGNRVLLTCYNEALSDVLAECLDDIDGVTVAPFLRHLEAQVGLPRREAARGEDLERYWDSIESAILSDATLALGRFNVVVVDEAQDFEDRWINSVMPCLLDEEPGSILMVGDRNQNVRNRDDSYLDSSAWFRASLDRNFRNPAPIAEFAARFGGAPHHSPDDLADDVQILSFSDEADLIDVVASEVSSLPPGTWDRTWVLTTSEAVRDLLRSEILEPKMVAWHNRDQGVICVTAEKVKGIEVPHVILVVTDAQARNKTLDQIVYAAATRATQSLTVITTPSAVSALESGASFDWQSVL